MSRTYRRGYDWGKGQYTNDRRDGSGKGCGFEYWSRRPLSGYAPGSETKRLTNRIERRQEKMKRGHEYIGYMEEFVMRYNPRNPSITRILSYPAPLTVAVRAITGMKKEL